MFHRKGWPMYPDTNLFIDGVWTAGGGGRSLDVINPATGAVVGHVACADLADLERAAAAADRGFQIWKAKSAYERCIIMRKAAELLRARVTEIATVLTIEQGKPITESINEANGAADIIDWFAEEGRRCYGRVVPPRAANVSQTVVREPIGPVAGFAPWNAPLSNCVRKIAAALGAGCSIVLKAPEETPASCAALVKVFADAGVPNGVVNLVFGNPAEISEYLIPHPAIRKITFTGSTPVGRRLSALAGHHLKRITLELGGHAPAIIFDDADVEGAIKTLAFHKFRNCGQVCISPTRFLVQESVYERFVEGFVAAAKATTVGDGLQKETRMGPLANARRIDAIESLVEDALSRGARLRYGGKRIGMNGYFFEPTVLTDVPIDARLMNEEPFGPIAPIASFRTVEEALREANRLPAGLAAYAYTKSLANAAAVSTSVESGMISINNFGLGLPETPFGGIKDSGHGSEGGTEALEGFLNTKFVSQMNC
jgi:succinate-semialdehyde dehydrogenase/glutarate-semialdehyde dehydrogenase